MFFLASKIFWVLARPLNFLFFLALAAMLAGRLGLRRLRNWMLAVSIGGFLVLGFTQTMDFLLLRLETIVAPGELPVDPAGIIVLGGGIDSISAGGGENYVMEEAADRLIKGLELRRLYPQARFIFSGGAGRLLGDEPPEAQAALQVVRAIHGESGRFELEDRSRTTWENAVEVAGMIGEERTRPWLLVTSAFHMPRALGCFRANGVSVIPVPTDWRADPLRPPFLTDEAPIQFLKASLLVKEVIGLIAYRLTGRIDSLLPH